VDEIRNKKLMVAPQRYTSDKEENKEEKQVMQTDRSDQNTDRPLISHSNTRRDGVY
jgi:hypothetical protein